MMDELFAIKARVDGAEKPRIRMDLAPMLAHVQVTASKTQMVDTIGLFEHAPVSDIHFDWDDDEELPGPDTSKYFILVELEEVDLVVYMTEDCFLKLYREMGRQYNSLTEHYRKVVREREGSLKGLQNEENFREGNPDSNDQSARSSTTQA